MKLLAQYFLEVMRSERGSKVASISDEALALLASHSWPGNVRELENLIERLTVLRGEGEIGLDDLPASFLQPHSSEPAPRRLPEEGVSFRDEVDRLETELITQALRRTDGNKNQAAQLLGLNRTTLLEKIKKKGLDSA